MNHRALIDNACAVQRTRKARTTANRAAAVVCIACWVFIGYLLARSV
jgi:hypothetical protein